MNPFDMANAGDLEVEVLSRAYRDLRAIGGDRLADGMVGTERAAFEAGCAAGCKATIELLNEAFQAGNEEAGNAG